MTFQQTTIKTEKIKMHTSLRQKLRNTQLPVWKQNEYSKFRWPTQTPIFQVNYIIFKLQKNKEIMRKRSHPSQFVFKLSLILENNQFAGIIDWNRQEGILHIKNPEVFIKQVSPKYFNHKHESLKSFVRQLNLYGFRKIVRKRQAFVFKNPLFTKENILVGNYLKRNKNKKKNSEKELFVNNYVFDQQSNINDNQISQKQKIQEDKINLRIEPLRSKIQSKCFIDHVVQESSSVNLFGSNIFIEQFNLVYHSESSQKQDNALFSIGKQSQSEDMYESFDA